MIMEFGRWDSEFDKLHCDPVFGRLLMKRHGYEATAVYKRQGNIIALDFLVRRDDRGRIKEMYQEFKKQLRELNNESF